MRCQNCGASLPPDTTICPVCEKETTKETNNNVPRLLIGGAVVLMVCLCVVLCFSLQKKTQPSFEEDTDLSSFSWFEPDESEQASSGVPEADGSYALTDAANRPLGTYSVLSMTKREFRTMDEGSVCSFWDNAADAETLYSTIRFEDGSGIVFSKGNSSAADYGCLDENAYISDVYGVLLRTEDGALSFLAKDPAHGDPLTADEEQTTVQAIGNVIVTSEAQTTAQNVTEDVTQNKEYEPAQTVYITDSGEKFHRFGCSYLNDSAEAISRAQAEEKGYTACSRCEP